MLLDTPVDVLPGTSPLTIKKLKNLDVYTFGDLVSYLPHRYEDFSVATPISRAQEGETVTVKGMIQSAKNEYTRRGFKLQKVLLRDESGEISITWINQPYLMHVFKPGMPLAVAGEAVRFGSRLTIQPKEWEILKAKNVHTGRIVPVYSEAGGLSAKTLREKLFHVVESLRETGEPDEHLPADIIRHNDLAGIHEAYLQVHFPFDRAALYRARRRLAFDELLTLQLSSLLMKGEWERNKVPYPLAFDKPMEKKFDAFVSSLPFTLTDDQKTAVKEIAGDLVRETPMNRFLQGDVGSGKTVVALLASYIARLNGLRSIIMAPTEILAAQHYETLSKLCRDTDIKIALQTGSKKTLKKNDDYDIAVGTHALLSSDMSFDRIGITVIDEQHRFGVAQRALLKDRGGQPHLLTMTATPIPRTLALTLYGELDISTISQMPKGRLPVKSYLVPGQKRNAAYDWIRRKVAAEKTQVFIICPLIEESDVDTLMTVKAAKKEYEHLKTVVFPELNVALLHGKLKPKEKGEIMNQFASGQVDILVSTSVVEVGIDIPNASVMIIEGAEKFGLAQLHQLRGRVGRGAIQSYCYLFSDTQDESTVKRLQYFASHTNGAELAEYDLRNRGPGNIFGTNQHGYMKLKVASLSDIGLIKAASDAARRLFERCRDLSDYPRLRVMVDRVREKQVSRD